MALRRPYSAAAPLKTTNYAAALARAPHLPARACLYTFKSAPPPVRCVRRAPCGWAAICPRCSL